MLLRWIIVGVLFFSNANAVQQIEEEGSGTFMRSVCVFLGSAPGNSEAFHQAAEQLGKTLALRNYHLVYGGTKIGLMKVLADAALENGGKVTGVITKELGAKGIVHERLTSFHELETMGQRIEKEVEVSDAFIVFPGGIGTIAELLDVWALKKINGLSNKPIGVLNVNGIFEPLLAGLKHLKEAGFMTERELNMLIVSQDIDDLLSQLFPQ